MKVWTLFWGIVVLFSTISFTYMSLKILYHARSELKEMFTALGNRGDSTPVD